MVYDHLLLEASRNRIEVIERIMPPRLKAFIIAALSGLIGNSQELKKVVPLPKN